MPRFFVDMIPEVGSKVTLDSDAQKHLRVLRVSKGAQVALFDGKEGTALGRLVSLGSSPGVQIDSFERVVETGPRRVLLQGLVKGTKLEEIVRATTEAGVSEIHLVEMERSVPRLGKSAVSKWGRLVRVAKEAGRQSGRSVVPQIHPPAPLLKVLDSLPEHATKLAFHPGAPTTWTVDQVGTVFYLVGPEGGVSPEELVSLQERGWNQVGLPVPVLRTEHAGLVATALIADRFLAGHH